MSIKEILDNVNDFKELVLLLIPVCIYIVKSLLSNTVDNVFLSKEKQLLSSICKIVSYILIFWVAFLALGLCMIQLKKAHNYSILNTISGGCFLGVFGVELLMFLGYAVTTFSPNMKKRVKKKKPFRWIKIFCCIAYCAMLIAFLLFEFTCLPAGLNDDDWEVLSWPMLEGLMYISLGLAVILTSCLYLAIDWLNTISPTRVYIIDKNGEKLYLRYASDKENIMCTLEENERVRGYKLKSKKEIADKVIYVEHGDETEEEKAPLQLAESDSMEEEQNKNVQ